MAKIPRLELNALNRKLRARASTFGENSIGVCVKKKKRTSNQLFGPRARSSRREPKRKGEVCFKLPRRRRPGKGKGKWSSKKERKKLVACFEKNGISRCARVFKLLCSSAHTHTVENFTRKIFSNSEKKNNNNKTKTQNKRMPHDNFVVIKLILSPARSRSCSSFKKSLLASKQTNKNYSPNNFLTSFSLA